MLPFVYRGIFSQLARPLHRSVKCDGRVRFGTIKRVQNKIFVAPSLSISRSGPSGPAASGALEAVLLNRVLVVCHVSAL